MTPAVSVIVPVYNVGLYIGRCAESLFKQTLESLEILFIDDCSPDKSIDIVREILEKYPHRKSLTRIIKMPYNSGQACVRKQGILAATGEYVIHCDGDDWVDTDYYEILYQKAVDENADIVIGGEVMEYADHQAPIALRKHSCSGKAIMQNWYRDTLGLFCHNKLVKRSIYTDNDILPWDGLNMWEDNGLFARLFYYADKVVTSQGRACYHYNRMNDGAMTSDYGIKQVEQMIGIASNLADFFESKSDGNDFKKTVDAFKYLARINLITDSFANYQRFKHTFSGSGYIAADLDPRAFSAKGRFRYRMVKFGLARLFIIMFKVRNLLR